MTNIFRRGVGGGGEGGVCGWARDGVLKYKKSKGIYGPCKYGYAKCCKKNMTLKMLLTFEKKKQA